MSNEAAKIDAQTEALAEVLAKAYHASPYRDAHVRGARAILEAGYRLPKPPTDDEREALARLVNDNHNCTREWDELRSRFGRRTIGDDYALSSAYKAADAIMASDVWRARHRGPITDGAIEAAARAIYDQATALRPDAWDREDEKERAWWREHARVVLEAAEAAR